jgi:predicted TIM-barrel fold metal-dependent hydrolase
MMADIGQLADEYRRQRDSLALFDVNCWMGKPLTPTFTNVDGVTTLKTMLARYGVRRAVLSHTMSVHYDAEAGNRALLDAIRHDDAQVGAATLVPEMSRSGMWPSVLKRLIADGIRLARLFPRSHNFLLDDDYLGGMLGTLQDLRLPVVLWHTEAAWQEIAEVCSRYRDLSLIVEGTGRKLFYDNRVYYPMLERFPNLYLETHNLTNYLGLDDPVRCFGSQRFLFGSFFPHEDPNSAAMLLTHGDFTAADRENIAHRNLEKLIGEVRQE